MNPWSNHQIGQATHREYEAKYGNRYWENESRGETIRSFGQHKLALALSGLSATGVIVTLAQLFRHWVR